MEKTRISKCCKVEAEYVYNDVNDGYMCPKCKKICEIEEVCAWCLGTGEVVTSEQVYPNEPHMADIGTRVCSCQEQDEDDDWEE